MLAQLAVGVMLLAPLAMVLDAGVWLIGNRGRDER